MLYDKQSCLVPRFTSCIASCVASCFACTILIVGSVGCQNNRAGFSFSLLSDETDGTEEQALTGSEVPYTVLTPEERAAMEVPPEEEGLTEAEIQMMYDPSKAQLAPPEVVQQQEEFQEAWEEKKDELLDNNASNATLKNEQAKLKREFFD